VTQYKVLGGLFISLTHDMLCAYCKSFTPAQWDDREQPRTTGFQFRWCIHELCWKCAAGVVEACPVCAASGPAVDLSLLEREAESTPMPPPPPHDPLWPWFLIGGSISAAMIAYGLGWLHAIGLG
jgi:hypothetical protein